LCSQKLGTFKGQHSGTSQRILNVSSTNTKYIIHAVQNARFNYQRIMILLKAANGKHDKHDTYGIPHGYDRLQWTSYVI
jgi:hypothetical protein